MFDKLNKMEKIFFDVFSVVLVLFYSYSAVLEPAATQYHRGIYVIITYILVFMLYKSKFPLMRVVDYFLILLSIVSVGYWILNFEAINYRSGAETELDTIMAMLGVLIGVEVARRVVGIVFVIIGSVMLVYGVYGDLAPELISHAGDTFPALCTSIFYKSDGVFGIMANVLATYVILFVIFGAFLEKSGAQRFFIDFPLAAVGHKIGGPGKVSVIASGLFGSISGSAIANTVSTGAFTIPMMKKAGFRPHVAGGIEPAASLGGDVHAAHHGRGGIHHGGIDWCALFTDHAGRHLSCLYVLFQRLCDDPLRGKNARRGGRKICNERHGDPEKGVVLYFTARRHHRVHAVRVFTGLFGDFGCGDVYCRQLVQNRDANGSERICGSLACRHGKQS